MLEKAVISRESGGDIGVMFNPSEYSLSTSVNYSSVSVPGLDSPITQYISGSQDTLTIQLMFSTYEPPAYDPSQKKVVPVKDSDMTDVTALTEKIYNLTKTDSSLNRPPVCTFKWGSLQFRGVVTDVTQKFTMFLQSGKPVRAAVDVTFKSVPDASKLTKSDTFGGSRNTKIRSVDESTSLWQIAFEECGDADKWKSLASANNIVNPLNDIVSGLKIKIPKLW